MSHCLPHPHASQPLVSLASHSPCLERVEGPGLHLWRFLWLPNSVELVRYPKKQPCLPEGGGCFQGGHTPVAGWRPAQSTKETGSLQPLLCSSNL